MDRIMLCVGLILGVMAVTVNSASNQYLDKDRYCKNYSRWAGDVYELLKQNPEVILNSMSDDEDDFVFINEWVHKNKSKDELMRYFAAKCMGREV